MVLKIFHLKKSYGFTILEVLIVVGLIGILSIVGSNSYLGSQRSARDSRRKIDLEALRQGLELYESDNSAYPDSVGSTENSGIKNALSPTYISSSNYPRDPRSANHYYYDRLTNTTYNLCAYLENPLGTEPVCPVSVSCGSQNCNYGVVQP